MKSADLILNAAENNPVYSLFEKPEVLTFLDGLKIEKTIWKDDIKSERSLRLATKSQKKPDDLIHSFNLDPKSFPEKFKNAIGGGGQEYRKIRTLHSSSLISLLCFYAVSKERPLHLNLEGRQVSFTSSKFEVPNFVGADETGKEHNSNMDVVLCGKDVRTGKKVILFLESKFSEYLKWGKYSGISNYVYQKTYTQLFNVLKRMGLKYEDCPDNPAYSDLASDKGKTLHYAGGIKQMVSHFIGVKNIADSEAYKNCDIYLGEILFRFPETVDPKNKKFNDYTNLYCILAEGLNTISQDKFRIIDQCFTYQEVFKSFDLDDAVRTFYSLPMD